MRSRHLHVCVLGGAIAAFTLAVSAVGFWKYAYYRYQGMDLAIYTNVLWSLTHGGGWWSSIQGSSYLGDHIEPILLLLAPLFHVWSDPRLLIILQACVLGLTAVPVYLFFTYASSSRAERSEGERSPDNRSEISPHDARNGSRALIPLLWLLNPLLWNAALFEFHALAFAPLFLLSAACAHARRRYRWFLLWMVLALSVREDIALIVVMFGVAALVERWSAHRQRVAPPQPERILPLLQRGSERGWKWALAPILLGSLWFLVATYIAAAHSASGAYKFLIYYGWLHGAASHPFMLLRHIVSIGNIDMGLGLLLPFLFLPILRPRWLLLAIPPLLQILLAGPGGSSVVVETHYALLFLPALVLAGVSAVHSISPPLAEGEREGVRLRHWLSRHFPLPRPFAITLGIAVFLAAAWMLGPFPGIASVVVHDASAEDRARRVAYDTLLARVPSDAPIAAGYAALPHVAARRGAYALPYTYLGVNQYALMPYELPDATRYMLLDQRDAITYAVQFPGVGWSASYARGGLDRLRKLISNGRFGVVAERNGIALLERGVEGALPAVKYFTPDAVPRGRLGICLLYTSPSPRD